MINKASQGLAVEDPKLRSDIMLTLDELAKDCYGLGVKNLTDYTITLDTGRKVPLRRFRADLRPGIKLVHDEGKSARVLFWLDSRYPTEVNILEILSHKVYDTKYSDHR